MEFLLSIIFKYIKLFYLMLPIWHHSIVMLEYRRQFSFIHMFISALPARRLFFFKVLCCLIRHSNHTQIRHRTRQSLNSCLSEKTTFSWDLEILHYVFPRSMSISIIFFLRKRVKKKKKTCKLMLIKMHCSVKCSSGLVFLENLKQFNGQKKCFKNDFFKIS